MTNNTPRTLDELKAARDTAITTGTRWPVSRAEIELMYEAGERNFDHASLDGASLNGASLNGAWLNHASLDGASLDNASLNGAWLNHASLNGASLDNASLNRASLDGASLDGASLNRASLDGASLNRASLDGAWLKGATFTDCVFPAEIPLLENPFSHVLAQIERTPESFDMRSWHGKNDCGTTHCMAGYVNLAATGSVNGELEARMTTATLAALIMAKAHNTKFPGVPFTVPSFASSNGKALAYIREMAALETAVQP